MSKVLVVDDAAANRMVLSALLKRAGHEVAVAESVTAALAHIRTDRPEAVLTDLRMPNAEDGVRLAREARRLSSDGGLRIALMTGDAASFHNDEHLFDIVLDKPVLAEDLLDFLGGMK